MRLSNPFEAMCGDTEILAGVQVLPRVGLKITEVNTSSASNLTAITYNY